MIMKLLLCIVICSITESSLAVSTKMDFGNDGEGDETTYEISNSTSTGDDDVEVKHTIVVSTKLRNNRKGIRSHGDENSVISHTSGRGTKKEDSGEVPVYNGYKAIESTRIRTPDTRRKASKFYPDAVFVNRNIRDDYDTYPNVIPYSGQWKPSSFFNNINWLNSDGRQYYDTRNDINHQNPRGINKKIETEAVREFYCQKCIELSNEIGKSFNGCSNVQPGDAGVIRRRSENARIPKNPTITPRVKIDGKLAKLN